MVIFLYKYLYIYKENITFAENIISIMNRHLTIELLDEGDKVNTYSPKFDNEHYNEFEKFFLKYSGNPEYKDDIDQILYRIEKIQEDGAADRHFRYESTKHDRIKAIPSHIETTKLRVYCIIINDEIVILGNGGLKTTRTYNVDPVLNEYVEDLKSIDYQIYQLQKQNKITTNGKELKGNLRFYIKDNK